MKKLLFLSPLLLLAATTPYMGLVKPTSGDTNYAQKFDTILNQIDAHDHSLGSGKQISTAGISSVSGSVLVNGTVTTQKLAPITGSVLVNGTVDGSKLVASSVSIDRLSSVTLSSTVAGLGNAVESTSSGAYSTTSVCCIPIAGMTVGIQVTGGRPVLVGLVPDGTANAASLKVAGTGTSLVQAQTQILRGGTTQVGYSEFGLTGVTLAGVVTAYGPTTQLYLDFPTSTTATYKFQVGRLNGATTFVNYMKLIAVEL